MYEPIGVGLSVKISENILVTTLNIEQFII